MSKVFFGATVDTAKEISMECTVCVSVCVLTFGQQYSKACGMSKIDRDYPLERINVPCNF